MLGWTVWTLLCFIGIVIAVVLTIAVPILLTFWLHCLQRGTRIDWLGSFDCLIPTI